MELSNRCRGVNRQFCGASLCRVHVVFAVDIRRRMMELRSTSLQCGRRIQLRQRCNPINGMARLTSRQGRFKRSVIERYRYKILFRHARSRIEELSDFQHGVHEDSQFSRHSHGSSFEADPLSKLKPPCSQRTLFRTARENEGYRSRDYPMWMPPPDGIAMCQSDVRQNVTLEESIHEGS